MRDVSKRAGVSVGCVSRVFADDKTLAIKEETRLKVLAAAREVGYMGSFARSRNAQGLKVGCLLSFTAEKYSDPYYMSIISAIDEQLTAEGLMLSAVFTENDVSDDLKFRQILETGIAGVIAFDSFASGEKFTKLLTDVKAVVTVDAEQDLVDFVGFDKYKVGMRVMKRLFEAGHENIAFVGGEDLTAFDREKAYLDAMAKKGFLVRQGFNIKCNWEPEVCFVEVSRLLKRPDRPTAIFAASDTLALAAVRAVHEAGLKCPGHVAIIGVNNLDFTAFTTPPLTTIALPTREMGRIAAHLIAQRVRGGSIWRDVGKPLKIYLPTSLIERASV